MAALLPWAALLASSLTPIITTAISGRNSGYTPPADLEKRYPDKKKGKHKEKYIYNAPKAPKTAERKFRLKHTKQYRSLRRNTYGDISF